MVNKLVRKKGIHTMSYDFPSHCGLDSIIFKPYENIMSFFTNHIFSGIDFLWYAAGLFSTPPELKPNWNGFMQDVTKEIHPSRSDIIMLPIIDLNPNDETCSTLLFVIKQSKKLNVMTPLITFDQPLCLKALEIITTKKLDIVSLLGRFHMSMSFYGRLTQLWLGWKLRNCFRTFLVKMQLNTCCQWRQLHKQTEHTFLQKVRYW